MNPSVLHEMSVATFLYSTRFLHKWDKKTAFLIKNSKSVCLKNMFFQKACVYCSPILQLILQFKTFHRMGNCSKMTHSASWIEMQRVKPLKISAPQRLGKSM